MKTAQHMREVANSKTFISLEDIEKGIESQASIGEYSYTIYDREISKPDIERLEQNGYLINFSAYPAYISVKFSYTISWIEWESIS